MKKRKEITFYLGTRLAWLLILFLGRLGRIQVKNRHYWDALVRSGKGFLVPIWHGKMLLPIFIHRNLGVHAMVSEHRDGEMIALTIHRLGYKTIRGSSTRGGRQAFKQMLGALKSGHVCTIMPDGPRGPRHEFKVGALLLASRAQVPMLPMTFAAQKPIIMKSWDRFTLWWPFSRICLIYGKPLHTPPDLSATDIEAHRRRIESAMLELERQADEFF